MAFTDEDLKRLKTGWSKPDSEYRVKTEILQALIARLEAAEAFAHAMRYAPDCPECVLDGEGKHREACRTHKAFVAWFKTAGK